jgi:DNA polymerase-1
MPGPLLAVDTPSLLYRAFYALPKSIKGTDGAPVNALLGTANLVLQAVEVHQPRATVLCFGAEAATYRVEHFAGYHADRPEMPELLVPQWIDAPAFFAAFGWISLNAGDLEADDLLGSLANIETAAGGETLLFTSDRDMYQCVSEHVRVLAPAKGGPELLGVDQVRARYGIEPGQVPDLIALRGDPSDGIPGAKGIGQKGAAELLRRYGDLDGVIAAAASPTSEMTPRTRAALTGEPELLHAFRDMATLRSIKLKRPKDAPLDRAGAANAARERGMNRLAERLATAN